MGVGIWGSDVDFRHGLWWWTLVGGQLKRGFQNIIGWWNDFWREKRSDVVIMAKNM